MQSLSQLSDEALENEHNRIAHILQDRLDRNQPWTNALIEESQALKGIIRERQRREDERESLPDYIG